MNQIEAIGQKQDEIRRMIAELEDLIVEYDGNDEKNIDDIEDMVYGCDDIVSDMEKCSRKLDQIGKEIEE